MPTPLAVCLEDLDARSPGERYLRCVAVPGRQPGLRVDPAGAVLWRGDGPVACELWVSMDQRLILYRPESAPAVVVRRAGRALDGPAGKPVVLLDQDGFEVGTKRMRVHVHGEAPAIAAPSFLPAPERAEARGGLRGAAAAVAIGAALGGAALFEVRCHPPSPVEPTPRDDQQDAGAPPPEDAETQPDIEVRVQPPAIAPMPPLPPPPPPPEPIEVRENPPGAPAPDMSIEKTDDRGGDPSKP
ncbi:MAG: hypothetical protein HY907_03235 [Deltaproteobacteria bacterium]|nr:hypothetical protein [Deltaproteobacteria bacterium]